MSQHTINLPYQGAMMAEGQIRSDRWHRGLPSVIVSRNHNQFPGIRFFSDDGAIPGVALAGTSGCEYAAGMANPHESVFDVLPPRFKGLKHGTLCITWPGYQNLKFKQEIKFTRENGAPLTRAEMGAQIAFIWHNFYIKHQKSFNGEGVPLGEHVCSFKHLRLHQVYSGDGRIWQAEVSYIKTPSVQEIYPPL